MGREKIEYNIYFCITYMIVIIQHRSYLDLTSLILAIPYGESYYFSII